MWRCRSRPPALERVRAAFRLATAGSPPIDGDLPMTSTLIPTSIFDWPSGQIGVERSKSPEFQLFDTLLDRCARRDYSLPPGNKSQYGQWKYKDSML